MKKGEGKLKLCFSTSRTQSASKNCMHQTLTYLHTNIFYLIAKLIYCSLNLQARDVATLQRHQLFFFFLLF